MSDNTPEETNPSDIVGTNKEFKRVENTLPERHSSKGLQPITPWPTDSKKTGRTIGSMGVRQEKIFQDINDISKTSQKEVSDTVIPATRQEKEDPILTDEDNRKFKTDADILPTSDRSIKHKELEKDIQRINAKRDAEVNAQQQHDNKKEDTISTPQTNVRKIEQQLKDRGHIGKQELNIFQDLSHDKKSESILQDEDTGLTKEEVETSIKSSGVVKQEIDSGIKDPNLSKQENPTEPPTTGIKKEEVDPGIKDPNLSKQEVDAFDSGDRRNKREKEFDDTTSSRKSEHSISVSDPGLEKVELDLDPKDHGLNSKFQDKNQEHDTINIKGDNAPEYDPNKSNEDLNVNRRLKSGIDGIDAESTQKFASEPLISTNYPFVDSSSPGEINNPRAIKTNKSTKQMNNLSYKNVLDKFNEALLSHAKEGFSNDETPKTQLGINQAPGRTNFDSSSIKKDGYRQQLEADHTKSGIANTSRSKKTQDPISYEPNNTSDRISEDRTDLSELSFTDSGFIAQSEVNHTKRSITETSRSKKSQDPIFYEPNNINNRIGEDRTDLSELSITSEGFEAQSEADHTKSGIANTSRSRKTQDPMFYEPDNINDRMGEDRSDLSELSITDSGFVAQTEADHTTRGVVNTPRSRKTQDQTFIEPNNVDDRIREDRSDLSKLSITDSGFIAQTEADHTTRGVVNTPRSKKSQDQMFYEPDNINDRIGEDRTNLSQHSLTDDAITINTNIDFSARTIGPDGRENKNIFDLPGKSPASPIISTEKLGNEIAYRDRNDGAVLAGYTIGTLASFLRPLGFLKKLENRLGMTNDIPSVMFNSAIPALNEIGGNGGLGEDVANLLKGNKTVFGFPPYKEGQAGTTADDFNNYLRHTTVQGLRMIANNLIDNAWLMGSSNDSDTDQGTQDIPELRENTIAAEKMAAMDNMGGVIPSSVSQDLRGHIINDSNGATGGYSTKGINKSPAHVYKNFHEYLNALRSQIAGNTVLAAFSTHDAINDKELNEKAEKRLRGSSAEQNEQFSRMIKQLGTFESRLYNHYDPSRRSTGPWDSRGQVKQGDDYENWILEKRRNQLSGKITGFNNDNYEQMSHHDIGINPELVGNYAEYYITSSSDEPVKANSSNNGGYFRTIILNNYSTDGRSKNYVDQLTNILDRENPNKGGDFNHFFNRVFSDDSMSTSVYSRDISNDPSVKSGKGTNITYNLEAVKNVTDPHIKSSLTPSTNRKDISDFYTNRRDIKSKFFNYIKDAYSSKEKDDYGREINLANLTEEYPSGPNYNGDTTLPGFNIDNFVKQRVKDSSRIETSNVWKFKKDGSDTSLPFYMGVMNSENVSINSTTLNGDESNYNLALPKDSYLSVISKYDKSSNDYGIVSGTGNNVKSVRGRSESVLEFILYNWENNTSKTSVVKSTHYTTADETEPFILRSKYGSENSPKDILLDIDGNDRNDGSLFYNSWGHTTLSLGEDKANRNLLEAINANYTIPYDPVIISSLTKTHDESLILKDNYTQDSRDSNLTTYNKYSIDFKKEVIDKMSADDSTTPGDIHKNKKESLEITDFTPQTKDDKLLFSRTIFGKEIKRHDPNENLEKDGEWKGPLKHKMERGLGRIIVNPNPQVGAPTSAVWVNDWSDWTPEYGTESINNTLFEIPLQFNPDISSESRQASWSSHTGYGRTNEFFVWNSTGSRQINFKSVYIATDGANTGVTEFSKLRKDGTIAEQYDDNSYYYRTDAEDETIKKNPWYNNFRGGFGGWTPGYVHRIIQKYRSLVLPMNMANPDLAVPPVIIIDFNSQFLRYTKHAKSVYARWIVEDIGIEPITELGFTKDNFPFGFEITMTLKEITNDWGDYEDIEISYLNKIKEFNASKR